MVVEQKNKEGLGKEVKTKVEGQEVEPKGTPQGTMIQEIELEVTHPRTKNDERKVSSTKGTRS